ncbi:MAG: ParB/RepB/Spo0J family partition protein [Parvularculaceae bacterium]
MPSRFPAGLLQPILVVPCGRRALRDRRRRAALAWAAQRAKLHDVPVIIRELTDEEAAEIALIENVQRVDLNPIEEARAYQRLSDVYGRTQDQIAKAVGKSRAHVTNTLRLLALPEKALARSNRARSRPAMRAPFSLRRSRRSFP